LNYTNDGGKIASCCAVSDRKLLNSCGVADTYTFLTNTWNTLLESYQQRVYKNTLATVKCQIQQVENPAPAVVISMEAAVVDNTILLDYMTSEVALEEPEIGSTDPKIRIDNNSMYDELRFGMPGDSRNYEDEAEESDERNDIPTASWRRWAVTELNRFDMGTSDADGYNGKDADDVDEEEEALYADGESTQKVEG
jgi:hypothetical protein